MTIPSTYDPIADDYAAAVRISLDDPNSVLVLASETLLSIATQHQNCICCDLACGEGHLTARLAELAAHVVGIDISARLITIARQHVTGDNVTFVQDDAQQLTTQPDTYFDLVVTNLALMDIPDLHAVYAAVYRVLQPGGSFAYTITHPCFQAPHAQTVTPEGAAQPVRQISRYASEGYWKSTYAAGIRGQVGAQHRTLATYLNALITTGFEISALSEPMPADPHIDVPSVLVVSARKPAK